MQSAINVEQAIVENLRQLPPKKQQEVLDFVEFLRQKSLTTESGRRDRHGLKGLWADSNIDIAEKDIAEARREMWGEFPSTSSIRPLQ
jgi:Protein of unknown function (DUF2281)